MGHGPNGPWPIWAPGGASEASGVCSVRGKTLHRISDFVPYSLPRVITPNVLLIQMELWLTSGSTLNLSERERFVNAGVPRAGSARAQNAEIGETSRASAREWARVRENMK